MKYLLLALLLCTASITNATNYYFSSSAGDDSRTAAQAQNSATPWKTLAKLNSIFSTLNAGDNVYFLRGDIFYGNIVISKSGTSGAPITLGAYGTGAKPVISGFTTVGTWTSLGANIWESSALATLSTCNTISIGGTNYAKGRTPDTGYWTISSTDGSTTITDATHLNAASANWTGAEVVVRELMYQVNKHPVTSASGNTITFGAGSIPANWGYFIQNDVRTCNLQNEWAYNASTKKVSIYSSGAPVNVKVPSVDEAVNLGSMDYITFDNLDLQGYNTTGINTTSRTGIKIQSCNFSFIGVNAIYGYPNSQGLKVTGSTFTDIGSRAIHGGSSSNAVFSGNTLLRIGHFAGMGSSGDDSFTGIISNGDYSEVSNNSITNVGYCGIRWDGNGTVIKNNFVNTTNYIKDDGGGIYCYPVQYGNNPNTQVTRTVRDNIVLNSVGAPEGSPYGKQGMGIYMDGQSPNIRVIHNSVSGGDLGLFINGGHDIFCDSNTTYNFSSGYYLLKIGGPIDNETVTHNIFVAAAAGSTSCGSGAYPVNFQPGTTSMPLTFAASNNVYARPLDQTNGWVFSVLGSNACNTLAQWQSITGKDAGTVNSPVTTATASNLRFEYNETSSAKTISLGATYIDMKNVSYPGTITLAPYSSAVLLKTGAATNINPTANAGIDKVVTLPTSTVSFAGTGADADGTIASYAWTRISGPTATITNAASATTTATALLQGVYQFELKVTDNAGAIGKDTVQITVNALANISPIANAGIDQTITLPASTVSLTGSGTDADGTVASYAWTKVSGPAGGTITSPTAASTTISSLLQGVYQFELKVTDNAGAIGRDTMQVTVNAAGNIPPTANAGTDKTITLPTSTVSLTGTGTDADGIIASYAWIKISGPASVTITTPASASTTVTGLTTGTYVYRLTVTDNSAAAATDDVQVIVNAAGNVAPIANAGIDQTVTLPTNTVTLTGTGTDSDGTIASYLWTIISGTGGAITNASVSSATVTGLTAGTYVFQLRVTDNGGLTATDNVQVIVNAPSAGPRVINVNVYGGTNPMADTKWNNWRIAVNTASSNFKYSDGTQSTVSGILSAQTSIIDNGANYATTATVCPPAVLRYNSSYSAQRMLTVNGLSASKQYTFTFYASSTVTGQGTSYLIGSVSNDIMSYNNIKSAPIVNVTANSSGTVVVKLLSIAKYNYIAGFTITEQTGSVTGRSTQSDENNSIDQVESKVEPKTEFETVADVVNIFPNPFINSAQIQLNGIQMGVYQLSLFDMSGKTMWKKSVSKNSRSLTETINGSDLRGGMYILEIISPDQKRTTYKIIRAN